MPLDRNHVLSTTGGAGFFFILCCLGVFFFSFFLLDRATLGPSNECIIRVLLLIALPWARAKSIRFDETDIQINQRVR